MPDMDMIDLDKDDDQIEKIAKELFEEEKRSRSHAEIMKGDEPDTNRKKGNKNGKEKNGQDKKKKGKWNPVALMFLFFALCGVTVAVYFYGLYCKERDINRANAEAIAASGQIISDKDGQLNELLDASYQDGFTEGMATAGQEKMTEIKDALRSTAEEYGIITALRELYPECVVFYDTSGYVFADIDESLGLNNLKDEQFIWDENGLCDYYENETIVSKRGIDVSKYNEEVDWKKVKQSGIEFAFVRVGFRGYGSGEITLDEMFESHITGAKKAGLKVGAYFFTEAITPEEAEEEAQFVIDQLDEVGVSLDYPIVFDVEKVNVSTARAENLTKEERTAITIAFCEKVKDAGYTPMIYGNIKCFMNMLDLYQLKDYAKWFAFYDDQVYYPYQIACWQYSEKGIVDGVKGEVDVNVLFDENFMNE